MTMFVQLATVQAKERMTVLFATNAKELVAIQNSTGMTIMSKQIDALKLALEALEYHTAQTRPIHQTNEAITAIKEALAQPEQWSPEDTAHRAGGLPMAQLKQEQGEPVAVVTGVYGGRFTYAPIKASVILPVGMALYTRPQPRTWVGLTDEQRMIEEDSKRAAKPSAEVQAKINELLNRKVV